MPGRAGWMSTIWTGPEIGSLDGFAGLFAEMEVCGWWYGIVKVCGCVGRRWIFGGERKGGRSSTWSGLGSQILCMMMSEVPVQSKPGSLNVLQGFLVPTFTITGV